MVSLRSVSLSLVVFMLATLPSLTGCQRTPEDLDKWIGAKEGMKKMAEWAASPDESMPVRKKAIRILVRQRQSSKLKKALENVQDKKTRKTLVDTAVSEIETQWKKQDFPTLDEKTQEEGGRIKYKGDSSAVHAVDAAYYIHPLAEGPQQEKLESILADWLSRDWQFRNKIGKTKHGQLLPRAGAKGRKNILKWLEETDRPGHVTGILLQDADEAMQESVAKIVKKRAEKAHPKLSKSLQAAIFEVRHEAIVPYLEKAVNDPKTPPALVDGSMELIKKIMGPPATSYFVKLVKDRKGKVRWAAVNDIIALRGKPGISGAAIAMPLEEETYAYPEEDSFKTDAGWFANFVVTTMTENDVNSISAQLVQMLDSNRWPAQVLAMKTAEKAHTAAIQRYILQDLARTWNEKEGVKKGDDKFIDPSTTNSKLVKAIQKHDALDKPMSELRSKDGRYGNLTVDKLEEHLLKPGFEDVVAAIEKLTSSRETIPGWGERKRLGELAHEVLDTLGS